MPTESAKSSPPSVSATMRGSALAISGMRNQASAVSIIAVNFVVPTAMPRSASSSLDHFGDQPDVIRAVHLGDGERCHARR